VGGGDLARTASKFNACYYRAAEEAGGETSFVFNFKAPN
jgi:hypothetical protein